MFSSTFESSTIFKCQLFYHAYTMRQVLHPFRSCRPNIFTGITFRYLGFGKTRKSVYKNVCSGRMFLKCFSVLLYGKQCFKEAKCVSAALQNTFCFLKQCFPYGKTGKRQRNMRSANVSGNMFLRFFKVFSREYQTLTDKNKYPDKFIFNGLVN